uniref:Uncharacterized protein n=1 Tax=Rhizophora mucronata TaxID=61149 RepID=A0A2P2K9B3_RHIMU
MVSSKQIQNSTYFIIYTSSTICIYISNPCICISRSFFFLIKNTKAISKIIIQY